VNADLVGAAGFWSALDKRKVSAGEKDTPESFGDAGVGPCADAHTLAMHRMPGDSSGGRASGGAGSPTNNGEISFARRAIGKLFGEMLVGELIFSHEDAAAGVFIQTMNDTRPERMASVADLAAVVQDGVHEGAPPVADSGMNYQTGRFVQAQQVVVLI
jgi:hypothetical protein